MLGLEKPLSATQAMRFIQGLDSARYATMQTSCANGLHNGRDLYPTDIVAVVVTNMYMRVLTLKMLITMTVIIIL